MTLRDAFRAIGADATDVVMEHHTPGSCWACGKCLLNGTQWCQRCETDACPHQAIPGPPMLPTPPPLRELPLLPGWEDYVDEHSDADPGL